MCTVHEKAEQNETGTKSQCKKIKKGGKRCGMQTSNKSYNRRILQQEQGLTVTTDEARLRSRGL